MKISFNDVRFCGDPQVSIFPEAVIFGKEACCEHRVSYDPVTERENACAIMPSKFNECNFDNCPKRPRLIAALHSADDKTAITVKSTSDMDFRTRSIVFPLLRISMNIVNAQANNCGFVAFHCTQCLKKALFVPDLLLYMGWRTDGNYIYCPYCAEIQLRLRHKQYEAQKMYDNAMRRLYNASK